MRPSLSRFLAVVMIAGFTPGFVMADNPQQDRIKLDKVFKGKVIKPVKPAERQVRLRELPPDLVRLGEEPQWTIARRPKTPPGSITPGADGTSYVERTTNGTRTASCTIGPVKRISDFYDLGPIRTHGFTVVSAEVDMLPAPFASDNLPIRRSSVRFTSSNLNDVNGGNLQGADVARATGVHIEYGISAKALVQPAPPICWAGYRLHITVKGPVDIDPLTGRKITQNPVN